MPAAVLESAGQCRRLPGRLKKPNRATPKSNPWCAAPTAAFICRVRKPCYWAATPGAAANTRNAASDTTNKTRQPGPLAARHPPSQTASKACGGSPPAPGYTSQQLAIRHKTRLNGDALIQRAWRRHDFHTSANTPVPGINMLDQASAGAQAAPTLAHERILPITAEARHPGRTTQNPVRQADLRAILSGQRAEHGLIVDQRR